MSNEQFDPDDKAIPRTAFDKRAVEKKGQASFEFADVKENRFLVDVLI